VLYKNGNVRLYPNGAAVNDPSVAGSTFTSVNWVSKSDGTMELRSEDTVIGNAKLSSRSSGTIADWLQGNIWNSNVKRTANSNSKASAASRTANSNSKPSASRTDATGTVIKIETASG